MNGARDNFFAGAAFSPDQHGGIALRDAGDELLQLSNLPAFADEAADRGEFAFQARTLEIGHGRDVAIMRLRGLVDAHIAHAVDLCRAYRDVADRMVSLEVRTAQMERATSPMLVARRAARAEMRAHAITTRAAADGALGAAAALVTYIREGLGALPVSDAEPRQLLLFTTAAS